MPQTTHLLNSDHDGLAQAAALLRSGALVAFPTETVYGLGGNARDAAAVAGIYAAKGRPSFNPLIVHVADLDAAELIAVFNDQARKIAAAFWPGPLTMVLPLRPASGIADLVTAGLETVAIRIPAHPVARALLREFGGAVAAPSANPSGKISPTTAAHVMGGLSGKIAGVVDGGACPVGVESTIISLAPLTLLREGGLVREDLTAVLGPLADGGDAQKPNAPGQLTSHYAPAAQVRLNVVTPRPDEIWIGFGDCAGSPLSLSPRGDLVEAATRLFSVLREADALQKPIAFAPIPEIGLGRAINDRLRRAAAPRD
ncbi:L-threonylcarbamoyladenylate synthase [Albirhodobacter sp. R86504]|uniref:L-threonylcarbamoyladenylate synthase n=1 Tax=Albirhodobacter sp. R86504 TaxID=3093848 RepID=UPI00367362ED